MRGFVTIDSSLSPVVIAKYHDFVPRREEFLKQQNDLEKRAYLAAKQLAAKS